MEVIPIKVLSRDASGLLIRRALSLSVTLRHVRVVEMAAQSRKINRLGMKPRGEQWPEGAYSASMKAAGTLDLVAEPVRVEFSDINQLPERLAAVIDADQRLKDSYERSFDRRNTNSEGALDVIVGIERRFEIYDGYMLAFVAHGFEEQTVLVSA